MLQVDNKIPVIDKAIAKLPNFLKYYENGLVATYSQAYNYFRHSNLDKAKIFGVESEEARNERKFLEMTINRFIKDVINSLTSDDICYSVSKDDFLNKKIPFDTLIVYRQYQTNTGLDEVSFVVYQHLRDILRLAFYKELTPKKVEDEIKSMAQEVIEGFNEALLEFINSYYYKPLQASSYPFNYMDSLYGDIPYSFLPSDEYERSDKTIRYYNSLTFGHLDIQQLFQELTVLKQTNKTAYSLLLKDVKYYYKTYSKDNKGIDQNLPIELKQAKKILTSYAEINSRSKTEQISVLIAWLNQN